MRRTKNTGVIFTGRVGSRMRIAKPRASRRMTYHHIKCESGPLRGMTIRLDKYGDQHTLPIVIRGEVGRYIGATWWAQQ